MRGTERTIKITEGTLSWRRGANQIPARKPRTTDGSEAMISMVGLTTRFIAGGRKAAEKIAASRAIGIAKSKA